MHRGPMGLKPSSLWEELDLSLLVVSTAHTKAPRQHEPGDSSKWGGKQEMRAPNET